jgi:hypothetical protein
MRPAAIAARCCKFRHLFVRPRITRQVRSLHSRPAMSREPYRHPHDRRDGFRARRVDTDPHHGPVEILDLDPELSGGASEQALRSRAARTADVPPTMVARVYRIDRAAGALSIVSAAVDGVLVSDLLAAMHAGALMVSDAVLFELAASIIGAVGALHNLPGAFAHGAIAPTHIALAPGGGVLLTDAAVVALLRERQYNREQLWRDYRLALPASATLPRFDQRSDVTQLGAVVLAILLRRPLADDEYPRRVLDRVLDATTGPMPYASAMRMWTQQALQLHPRAVFASASDASRAFADMTAQVGGRRAAAQALDRLVREMSGRAGVAAVAADPKGPVLDDAAGRVHGARRVQKDPPYVTL